MPHSVVVQLTNTCIFIHHYSISITQQQRRDNGILSKTQITSDCKKDHNIQLMEQSTLTGSRLTTSVTTYNSSFAKSLCVTWLCNG